MISLASPKVLPILAGAMVLLVVLLGLQSCRLHNAGERHGETSQALRQCEVDRADHRQEAIAARDELTEIVMRLAIDSQAVAEALLASERQARERDRADRAEAQARAEIYAQVPDCQTWGLIPVCLDIAERMHDRRRDLIDRWQGESDE